jgi:hypothetical protein
MKKLVCHCGAVEAEINLDGDLAKVIKCNCSICKRKVAKHYFCSDCGIYTHHNPRINPAMTGFNVGCIDEINTFDMKEVPVNDGQNHPLDKK